MNYVALRMLTGDRAKYLSLIFAIAFSTFLLENQSSIFAGIMKRTTSQILDVTDADVWVMDKKTLYIVGLGAVMPNGTEIALAPGLRLSTKTIYKIPMLAQGYLGRAK